METPVVEVVNTASKVGVKLDKYTLIGFAAGAVITGGVLFGAQKLRDRRAAKKFSAGFDVQD